MDAALKGLKAYQDAARPARPAEMPVAAEAGRVRLLDYGGAAPPDAPKAVFVPSLINPPTILDLAEENSLLRWLGTQGIRPYLVDWGAPLPGEAGVDIAGHVETMLLPLLAALGEPVHLAGYCLGGTMAAAAAGPARVRSLTMIAAPWRFDGFGDEARDGLAELWSEAADMSETLGALPMEVLQTAFWRLDPARTVAKYEAFGRLDPESPGAQAFIALEDWANDGAPLTYAAGCELVERMFVENVTGKGEWKVAGEIVDPAALPCPVLDIVSTTDRIVPEASAARAGEVRTLAQGHVGMVVGGRARTALWEPLAEWLSQAQHR